MRKLSILGVTGSIGTQTLDVIRNSSEKLELIGITANTSVKKIIEIIEEFNPKYVGMMDKKSAEDIRKYCIENNKDIEVLDGIEGLSKIATLDEIDIVVTSVVGMIGLEPTMKAIEAKKDIALANKETLVVAGEIVMKAAKENNVKILPVDSEHSAIEQSLKGNSLDTLKKIILTASGGPFRGKTIEELKNNLKEIDKRPTVNGRSMISLWKDLSANYVDKTFVSSVIKRVQDNEGNNTLEIIFDGMEEKVKVLSSGQLHILSLITYICANIHYRSLLIIDEPEVHLHPHITMEFIATLSKLLTVFKSYSIIATHTPLVIREMAGRNVYVMQKMENGIPQIAPVAFETLGEDVSTLYRNLFGYDENSSYFKKMVDELCSKGKSYKYIVDWFQRGVKLNVNALLIIRDAIEARDNA